MFCYNTPISACEKDGRGQWQRALVLFCETLGVKVEPATIIYYSTQSSA